MTTEWQSILNSPPGTADENNVQAPGHNVTARTIDTLLWDPQAATFITMDISQTLKDLPPVVPVDTGAYPYHSEK